MWELLFPLKYLAIVASQAATPEVSEAGDSQVKQPVCHTSYFICFRFLLLVECVWMQKRRNTAVTTLRSPCPEQHSSHCCHIDNSSNDAALSRFAAKRHGEGEGGETGFCRAQARSGARPFEVNQANAMKIKGGEKLEMKRGPRKKRALYTSCTTLHVSSILSSIA